MEIITENNLRTFRPWMLLGGVLAFFAFSFIAFFIPFYTYTTEIELVGRWSMIVFGALLGGAISFGKNRRRFGNIAPPRASFLVSEANVS